MESKTAPNRPFEDAARMPAEEGLRTALGPAYQGYAALVALTSGFRQEWTFAGRSGWMLKVHARGKALLYLIPLEGAFRLSMAIRENEREALSADPEFGELREKLDTARKFVEGYALQFDVTGPHLDVIEPFLRKLMALRA